MYILKQFYISWQTIFSNPSLVAIQLNKANTKYPFIKADATLSLSHSSVSSVILPVVRIKMFVWAQNRFDTRIRLGKNCVQISQSPLIFMAVSKNPLINYLLREFKLLPLWFEMEAIITIKSGNNRSFWLKTFHVKKFKLPDFLSFFLRQLTC